MDVVPEEYGTFSHTFHLICVYFSLLLGLTSSGIVCCGVLLIFWYGLVFEKLSIYKVPPEPFSWSCQGFGYLWWAFVLIWMPEFKITSRYLTGRNSMLPQI